MHLAERNRKRFINLEKNGGKKKPQQQPKQQPEEDVIRTLVLPEKLTIRELADKDESTAIRYRKETVLKRNDGLR